MRQPKRSSRLKFRRRLSVFALFCAVPVYMFWSIYRVDLISSQYDVPASSLPHDSGLHSPPMMKPMTHPNFTIDFPLCLVHIGKAAGSSISCGLGLMYANCEGMPRDALPQTYYFHLQRNTCPRETTRTYLVTLRNPITRLRSWFNFEKNIIPYRKNKQQEAKAIKQRGRLFSECYSDFEDLALHGLRPLEHKITAVKTVNMTCPERAWAAALGARAFSYHEYYNYEYYYNSLQSHMGNRSTASIQVLRAEHLQQDWSKISSEKLFRRVNQGLQNRTEHALTQDEKLENLCRALCQEIQFYKRFLQDASNLSPTERTESLHELLAFCPRETLEVRECTNNPEFPQLRISKGKYDQEAKKRFYSVH